MKQLDKNALPNWEKYKQDIHRSTPVDTSMTEAERERRRLHLEAPFRLTCHGHQSRLHSPKPHTPTGRAHAGKARAVPDKRTKKRGGDCPLGTRLHS